MEIEGIIRKTRQQIAELPRPPPANALNEVARLLKDFDADVRRNIEGVPYKEGIIQSIRVPSEAFRCAIQGTAPNFKPYTNSFFDFWLPGPEFLKHEENGDTAVDKDKSRDGEGSEPGPQVEVGKSIYVDEVYARMTEWVSL